MSINRIIQSTLIHTDSPVQLSTTSSQSVPSENGCSSEPSAPRHDMATRVVAPRCQLQPGDWEAFPERQETNGCRSRESPSAVLLRKDMLLENQQRSMHIHVYYIYILYYIIYCIYNCCINQCRDLCSITTCN